MEDKTKVVVGFWLFFAFVVSPFWYETGTERQEIEAKSVHFVSTGAANARPEYQVLIPAPAGDGWEMKTYDYYSFPPKVFFDVKESEDMKIVVVFHRYFYPFRNWEEISEVHIRKPEEVIK